MRILLVFALILWPHPSHANSIEEDKTAARVLAYFMVGQNENPDANVTIEQFENHLEILKTGGYTVMSLDDIFDAYTANRGLPDKTVAITFDGGDKSILTNAAPLLEKYKFPYAIFISTYRADQHDPRYLNWQDIKKLNTSGLATVGLHSQSYSDISFDTTKNIRKSVNNATARLREKLNLKANFFAYPFGEFGQNYKNVLQDYNFKGIFGQHSGVIYQGAEIEYLPRFTMTENYAQEDRFRMVIESLPLPVEDLSPSTNLVTATPAIGFTVNEALKEDIKNLSCFASGQGRPLINIIGNRIELRLASPITQDRFRVNCTLPAKSKESSKIAAWRWMGQLYQVNDTALPDAPQE